MTVQKVANNSNQEVCMVKGARTAACTNPDPDSILSFNECAAFDLQKVSVLENPIDEDVLSILTMSSPRSRTASEVIFADFELLMSRSEGPPVGTTLPPVYPRNSMFREPQNNTNRRNAKRRIVNRPLK